MNAFRYFFVIVVLSLFSWQIFMYSSVDEVEISKSVGEGAAARFIQSDEETLELLHERLQSLEAHPSYFFKPLAEKNFGREMLFFSDRPELELEPELEHEIELEPELKPESELLPET